MRKKTKRKQKYNILKYYNVNTGRVVGYAVTKNFRRQTQIFRRKSDAEKRLKSIKRKKC